MRAIIHLGMQKTGSSAIQAQLAQGREKLAAEGFFYPSLGEDAVAGHWQLAALWAESLPPAHHLAERLRHMGPGAADRVTLALETAIAQARAHGDGVVLLSAEHLSHPMSAPGGKRLTALFARHGVQVTALAYLRPVTDHYPSAAQQQVKRYGHKIDPALIDHLDRLETIETIYGADALRLRVFSRQSLLGGDVTADVAQWIGAVCGRALPDLGGALRANESMPAAASALLLRLGEARSPESDPRLFGLLRGAIQRAGLAFPRLTLPETWRARLEANAAPRWNAMLARSDHPEPLRAALRLREGPPSAPIPAPISAEEMRDWVDSAWDETYNAALAAWIEGSRMGPKSEVLALLRGAKAP
ncbi:hypothetical protein [Stagnihabitans tardus]|uniref:Uncharacterized protein n=1 Tax=Stagnihabitans tardus TaxID=2699202 RepID=A0AAE5BU49_9RHOB|nr:hypothetical protein [Stagnihabitans tardus]NBZ87426.1 hypothetical protein [Stagnihabitans tardus]